MKTNRIHLVAGLALAALALAACGSGDDTSSPVADTAAPTTAEPECKDGQHRSQVGQICENGAWVDDLQATTTTTEAPTTTTTAAPTTTTLSPDQRIKTDLAALGITLDTLVSDGYVFKGDSWSRFIDLYADDACENWRTKPSFGRNVLEMSKAAHKVEVIRTLLTVYCPDAVANFDSPPVAMTVEEVAASLEPTVAAWVSRPSGSTFDALAAQAQTLLDTADMSSAPIGADGGTVRDVLRTLSVYPGSDSGVYRALMRLPISGLPPIILIGTYLVGSEVQPGTYRAQDVENCYWATLDQAGEINDNNFVNSAPQVLATIRSSDFAFENDCALMVKVA
jgi:hypothetical protein